MSTATNENPNDKRMGLRSRENPTPQRWIHPLSHVHDSANATHLVPIRVAGELARVPARKIGELIAGGRLKGHPKHGKTYVVLQDVERLLAEESSEGEGPRCA